MWVLKFIIIAFKFCVRTSFFFLLKWKERELSKFLVWNVLMRVWKKVTCATTWALHFQGMKCSIQTNQFLQYLCTIFYNDQKQSKVKLIFCLFVHRVLLWASKRSFSLWNSLSKWFSTTASWTWSCHRTLYYTKTLPKMLLLNGSEAFPSFFFFFIIVKMDVFAIWKCVPRTDL